MLFNKITFWVYHILKNKIYEYNTKTIEISKEKHSKFVLSIYRDNKEKISAIIITPVYNHKQIYNKNTIHHHLNHEQTGICISKEKYIYITKLIDYLKNNISEESTLITLYVNDRCGIDVSFLFDISYYNNHFIKIKDVPIGNSEAKRALLKFQYSNIENLEIINANCIIDSSIELLFSELTFDPGIPFEEIDEHIHYGIFENKELYIFYHHIILTLKISEINV